MPRKVKTIALDLASTSFIENYRLKAAHGVIHYAREHTSWKLMFNVPHFSLVNQFTKYEDLKGLGADGLIFFHTDAETLDRVRATGLPAACITNLPPDAGFPFAITDDREVGRLAARHFLERGFRHFAYCGGYDRIWSRQRHEGFDKEIRGEGFKCDDFAYEQATEWDHERDLQTARELRDWLKSLPKPLAVMAENDTKALHVLEACQALKLEVPNEVALIGVDNNMMICDSLIPSLSSVEQDTERVGYEAAGLLDRLLSRRKMTNGHVVVPPRGIVTRMSSDILAVDDPAVARALLFIRDHLSEPIGVVDVVRASGVSRSNLESRFRNRLHNTINNEIRKRRLKRAKTLLLDTMLSLEEIAEISGFRRATYFSNIFTSQTGMAPGAWRRKYRGFQTTRGQRVRA